MLVCISCISGSSAGAKAKQCSGRLHAVMGQLLPARHRREEVTEETSIDTAVCGWPSCGGRRGPARAALTTSILLGHSKADWAEEHREDEP